MACSDNEDADEQHFRRRSGRVSLGVRMEPPESVAAEVAQLDGGALVLAACRLLGEAKEDLVVRCLAELGRDEFVRVLVCTAEAEASGGLLTQTEPQRRRTPGGAFFALVRASVDKETRRRIFFLRLTDSQKRKLARAQQAQQSAKEHLSPPPSQRRKT
jgi:hypothetical protein